MEKLGLLRRFGRGSASVSSGNAATVSAGGRKAADVARMHAPHDRLGPVIHAEFIPNVIASREAAR